MVIVVTGTIAPKKQDYLIITEIEERLLQYRNTLEQLIMSKADTNIVFCDNSAYDLNCYNDLVELANENNKKLELLSFLGDAEAVKHYGKGYGEGEILQYAFQNSKLLQSEIFFLKLTGRLKVDNIATILEHVDESKIYFNIPNRERTDMYDTRLYGMPTEIYKHFFLDEYVKVNDKAGMYLEYVYTDIILENGIKTRNLPRYPRIVGISGSNGLLYDYKIWKSVLRDIFSYFNIYGKIRVRRG